MVEDFRYAKKEIWGKQWLIGGKSLKDKFKLAPLVLLTVILSLLFIGVARGTAYKSLLAGFRRQRCQSDSVSRSQSP